MSRKLGYSPVREDTLKSRLESIVQHVTESQTKVRIALTNQQDVLITHMCQYNFKVLQAVGIPTKTSYCPPPSITYLASPYMIENCVIKEREELANTLKHWRMSFQEGSQGVKKEREEVVSSFYQLLEKIWKVSFPNRETIPALSPSSPYSDIEKWIQTQSGAYESAISQSQQTGQSKIAQQQEVTKDMLNLTNAFLRRVFELNNIELEEWPYLNENSLTVSGFRGHLEDHYTELSNGVKSNNKAHSERIRKIKDAATNTLNGLIVGPMEQPRPAWQLRDDDDGDVDVWIATQGQTVESYITKTVAGFRATTAALEDVIREVSKAFESIFDPESGFKKPEPWPQLSVEAPDVAITFFRGVPNDLALQLARRSLAAARTDADLKQAHMDIEFMIASASELVHSFERQLSLPPGPPLQREDIPSMWHWFTTKRLVVEGQMAQNTKKHLEDIKVLLSCLETFSYSAFQQAVPNAKLPAINRPGLTDCEERAAKFCVSLGTACKDQRDVAKQQIRELTDHVNNIVSIMSTTAVAARPSLEPVHSDWNKDQLGLHRSALEKWLTTKMLQRRAEVIATETADLHKQYGACITDTMRIVYQQSTSVQLLMYRQIPELDIGKTGSLEETMANATALQDWMRICSEKSGNFTKGIWGKHKQLLEALKDMIKHDRVLSKGYIELREDMKEAMEVIEAQGV